MSLTLASCSDLFEPADENNRGLNEIYNEPTYAQGLLGYGYAMLPYNTKSVTDIATDDAVSNDLTNSFLKMATGSWTANSDPMSRWANGRACIQYLNIFLQEVDKVNWSISCRSSLFSRAARILASHSSIPPSPCLIPL